jgi:hypothetical protein
MPQAMWHIATWLVYELSENVLVGLVKILEHDSVETAQIYTQKRLADLETAIENVKFY